MLHLPADIIHRVFLYIHDIEDISPLNLVCKDFASLLQSRQYKTIILHHAERAETLAAFCTSNQRLLSETTHLQIGDQFTETYEAEELWAFLFAEEGLELLRLMGQVRRVSLLALNPDLEGNMAVSYPLGVLALTARVEKLTVSKSSFSDITKLCALSDPLHTVRELEIDSGITFKFYLEASFARSTAMESMSDEDDAVASLQSVIFRNASPRYRADTTIMLFLIDTGRLDSVETLAVDCGSHHDVFVLAGYIAPMAGTLRCLMINNPAPLHQMETWEGYHSSDESFPSMPHLERLHLIGFTDEFVDWLITYIGSGLPEGRRMERSPLSASDVTFREDTGFLTEYMFSFE
jgi:hypothetical protein